MLLRGFAIKIYFLCKFILLFFHIFRIYLVTFRGSRREFGTSGKVRVSRLSYNYGNRWCEFRFPQFGAIERAVWITLTHGRKTLDRNDVWKYERQTRSTDCSYDQRLNKHCSAWQNRKPSRNFLPWEEHRNELAISLFKEKKRESETINLSNPVKSVSLPSWRNLNT